MHFQVIPKIRHRQGEFFVKRNNEGRWGMWKGVTDATDYSVIRSKCDNFLVFFFKFSVFFSSPKRQRAKTLYNDLW